MQGIPFLQAVPQLFPVKQDRLPGVVDRCDLPDGFNVDDYVFFQGIPTKVLNDYDVIDIGSREIEVLHTPGHSFIHATAF